MMFGESLLMENSVDAFAAHGGAGSKLEKLSDVKGITKTLDKIPS